MFVLSLKLVCEVILINDFFFLMKILRCEVDFFFFSIKMYRKLLPMQSYVIEMDFPPASIERF